MTCSVRLVTGLFLLFILLVASNGIKRRGKMVDEMLTEKSAMPIFELMREDGETRLEQENEEIKKKTESKGKEHNPINQYLVAIVVTRGEIRKVGQSRMEKEKQDILAKWKNEGRYIFETNKCRNDKPKCADGSISERENGGFYWHGEIIAIEDEKILNMLAQFKEKRREEKPYVLIYSHFIPCAKVGKTGYSCSEQLAKFMDENPGLEMYVAFTTYFPRTDGRAAHDFMKNGGITALQNMVRTYRMFLPGSVDSKEGLFQEELFDCIYQLPIAQCCTGSPENRKQIVAYFVNSLTYHCCEQKINQLPYYRGEVYRQNLDIFRDCAYSYLLENVGDDCEPCSRKYRQDLGASQEIVLRCVEHSLSVAQAFGVPDPIKNPYSPKWTKSSNKFKNPYPSYADPQKLKQNIFCEKRQFSAHSLCTKLESKESENKDVRLALENEGASSSRAAPSPENKGASSSRRQIS